MDRRNNSKSKTKLVDALVQELKSDYVLIGRRHVKAWQGWLLLGLAAGAMVGIVSVANRQGEVEQSQAEATSHLRYFGYFGVDCFGPTSYTSEVVSFTNFVDICPRLPSLSIVVPLARAEALGLQAVIQVGDVFFQQVSSAPEDPAKPFGGSGTIFALRPDYRTRWNTFVRINNLTAHSGSVISFYLMDEPTWRGISPNMLQAAAEAIRVSFPTTAIGIIEAYPSVSALVVPPSIDWIGFDRYGVRDPRSDPGYQQAYATLKSKRSAEQGMVVVMDAWWESGIHGNAGISQGAMAEVARNYYEFAQSDPDAVGIWAFLWPSGIALPGSIGARDLPQAVQEAHRGIGRAIIGRDPQTKASTLIRESFKARPRR